MWRSPEIEMGYPLNGWFIVEHPIKMDDMGVPLYHRFRRPPYDIAIQIYKKEFAMVSVTDGHLKPNPATRGPQRRFCYWNGVLLLISIPGSGGLVGTPILKHTWMKRTYRPVIGTGKILIFLVLYFCMNLKRRRAFCKFRVRQGGLLSNHVRSFIFNTRLRCS